VSSVRIALALAVLLAGCAPGSRADPGAPTDGTGSTGTSSAPAASSTTAASPEVRPADGVTVAVLDVEQESDSLGSGVTYRLEVRNDRNEPVAVIPPQAGQLQSSTTEPGLVEAATPASREQRGDEAPPTVDTVVVGAGQTLALEPPSGAAPISEGAQRLRICVEVLEGVGPQASHGQEGRMSLDAADAALLACSEPTPIGG